MRSGGGGAGGGRGGRRWGGGGQERRGGLIENNELHTFSITFTLSVVLRNLCPPSLQVVACESQATACTGAVSVVGETMVLSAYGLPNPSNDSYRLQNTRK